MFGPAGIAASLVIAALSLPCLAQNAETPASTSSGFFPPSPIFAAPLADPRQPRFSASIQGIELPGGSSTFGAVALGGSWGIWEGSLDQNRGVRVQIGLDAGAFSLFDLEAGSQDLWNTDFVVGVPVSFSRGRWSLRLRPLHASSHLGDEFLLFDQIVTVSERIELSYESLEGLVAWQRNGLRLYGGGERIFSSVRPLERWRVQGGAEWTGSATVVGAGRIFAAVDVQSWEETDWDAELAAAFGLVFPNPWGEASALRVMIEAFDGPFPHGQLYEFDSRWVGLTVALTR